MLRSREARLWVAYGLSLLILAGGVVVRWQFGDVLGQRALYSTFLPAVIVAAYFGGLWAGLSLTLLAALAANAVVEPRLTLQFKGPGDTLAMLLFALTGVIISVLSESLHRAHHRIVDEVRRRAAEREIRIAKERLELAIHGSNISIWDFEMPEGAIENSRPTMTNVWEALGHDPVNAVADFASTFDIAVHPDDREQVMVQMQEFLKSDRREFEIEYRALHKDGSVRWHLSRGIAIRDPVGKPARFLGTTVNITALKRLEDELRHARDAAETANRAKDEFLANVSHEIRTPMNAILGMTDLVLETPLASEQRQNLRTVKSAGENLLGIINDVLDFSKIEAGKLTLDVSDFSLRFTVADALRAIEVRALRKGLKFSCNIPAHVPDALVGDAGRLRQVLLNLVGNAVKFTDSGKVMVEIEVAPGSDKPVAARHDGVTLRFAVRDTGIGIPRDKQESIFHAFEQEDTSITRKYGGTGLGLTIAAQLTALMGGEITVASEPGCGSTFTFTARFALGAVAAEPIPVTNLGSSIESVSDSIRPLRVLVAEDNEFNAQLMQQLLSRRGHAVRVAGDGKEARSLATTGEFDLLLLDLHMPEGDGFEVIRAIRAHEQSTGSHLPVVALTARSRPQDRDRCLAAGMDEFVSKPIQADKLLATIDRLAATYPPTAERRKTDVLDPRVLLATCGSNDEILKVLCEGLRDTLPDHLARLQAAHEGGNAKAMSEIAHKLCGMAGAFSTAAQSAASALEDCAEAGRLDEAGPLVEQLQSIGNDLLDAVGEKLTVASLVDASPAHA